MFAKLLSRLTDPVFYRKRWRQILRPVTPAQKYHPISLDDLLSKIGPWLVVIAHPDDELFASGLISELSVRGKEVHLLCLTRGEGGMTGGATREDLGRMREAELRHSASALGASSVTFLDHADPIGTEHRVYAPSVSKGELALEIRGQLARWQPSVVLTHGSGGEYWHPAHLLLHSAVLKAARGEHIILTLHAWQKEHPLPGLLNRDDPADLIYDGTPHRGRRLAALQAHSSQCEYFASRGGGSLEGFIDLTFKEAYRHYPGNLPR